MGVPIFDRTDGPVLIGGHMDIDSGEGHEVAFSRQEVEACSVPVDTVLIFWTGFSRLICEEKD